MLSRVSLSLFAAAWLAPLGAVSAIIPLEKSIYSRCSNITIRVTASTTGLALPPLPNLDKGSDLDSFFGEIGGIVSNAGNKTLGGGFFISGHYCPAAPDAPLSSQNVTQVLVHGGSYTKEYWNGGVGGNPDDSYSWQIAASKAGHATLAVDRLCDGQSTRPDALTCQLVLSAEIIHEIFGKIRSGEIGDRPTTPILAGHSLGSLTALLLIAKYPDDVDTVILTGYTNAPRPTSTGPSPLQFRQARLADPVRFPRSRNGYVLGTNSNARIGAFWAGEFDRALAELDARLGDTIALGEFMGVPAPTNFPGYKGKVFIVSGALEASLCAPVPQGNCSLNTTNLELFKAQFPDAESVKWYLPPKTGHLVNLHKSAPETYGIVNTYLLNGSLPSADEPY
ncbi:MAG: hypothetical protein M1825_003150 [Sarcosagium campestre]|nr:MAG: hypothetical protein M1825_003150 [Sarcosagium campestre]